MGVFFKRFEPVVNEDPYVKSADFQEIERNPAVKFQGKEYEEITYKNNKPQSTCWKLNNIGLLILASISIIPLFTDFGNIQKLWKQIKTGAEIKVVLIAKKELAQPEKIQSKEVQSNPSEHLDKNEVEDQVDDQKIGQIEDEEEDLEENKNKSESGGKKIELSIEFPDNPHVGAMRPDEQKVLIALIKEKDRKKVEAAKEALDNLINKMVNGEKVTPDELEINKVKANILEIKPELKDNPSFKKLPKNKSAILSSIIDQEKATKDDTAISILEDVIYKMTNNKKINLDDVNKAKYKAAIFEYMPEIKNCPNIETMSEEQLKILESLIVQRAAKKCKLSNDGKTIVESSEAYRILDDFIEQMKKGIPLSSDTINEALSKVSKKTKFSEKHWSNQGKTYASRPIVEHEERIQKNPEWQLFERSRVVHKMLKKKNADRKKTVEIFDRNKEGKIKLDKEGEPIKVPVDIYFPEVLKSCNRVVIYDQDEDEEPELLLQPSEVNTDFKEQEIEVEHPVQNPDETKNSVNQSSQDHGSVDVPQEKRVPVEQNDKKDEHPPEKTKSKSKLTDLLKKKKSQEKPLNISPEQSVEIKPEEEQKSPAVVKTSRLEKLKNSLKKRKN